LVLKKKFKTFSMLFHPDFIYFIYLLTTKSLNINIIALFLSVYFDKTT